MVEQEKHEEIARHLGQAKTSLTEALNHLRHCLYMSGAADKTIHQLLDEENHLVYSIVNDMATIKALISDVTYLHKKQEK